MTNPAKGVRAITDLPQLPPRDPRAHKGTSGHVAIVAGSRGMSGAAVLSAWGALRGGAGLVRVYTPASVQPIIAMSEPCLMTVPVDEDAAGRFKGSALLAALQNDADWPHAIAIGPGIGQSPDLAAALVELLATIKKPIVIDADGLNNLTQTDPNHSAPSTPNQPKSAQRTTRAKHSAGSTTPSANQSAAGAWWHGRDATNTVITPHPGEMARLRAHAGLSECNGQDDATRRQCACEFAAHAGVVTVLKGHHTVVAAPTAVFTNTTGNPGMATGGMGDVLTGLIAALIGQGLPPFEAAALATHTHGRAADQLAKTVAPVGYLAREVADAIPAALAEATRSRMGFR